MEHVLITGASGGIGEALANKLAYKKHNLVLVARNAEKLDQLSRSLMGRYKVDVQFIAADLSLIGSGQEIFTETRKRELEIGMLFNVAGIGSSGEFTDINLQTELNLIQLNIASLVALSHVFLTEMKKNGKGYLINISSMTAFMPVPYMATYAASKVFVRSFTQALSEEYKPYGIHVMLVCPGLTRTNFNSAAGLDNRKSEAMGSNYSNSSSQTPEEVAEETLSALEKKKYFIISGHKNRIRMKISSLIPNAMIAKWIGNNYRKTISNNL